MTIETDVQGLTDATTDLLVAVNVSKATLDAKVADASASAASATASATAANTSAGNASGFAASALAVYGSAAAQQAALMAAQSAASLAQGYALSASSAIQQDLSGVTAQALHRSPNAVTAMFVYDTSKDSDGGAWTEKCQHTSWYNEALNGKWLGAHVNELNARSVGATLGPDKITNGSFSTASGFGITAGAINTSTGRFEFNGVATGNLFYQDGPANSYLATSFYLVEFDYSSNVPLSSYIGGGSIQTANSGTGRFRGVVQGTAGIRLQINVGGTSATGWIDNLSVREVTALTTASGDYYQSTADGKFYRLWKNLLNFPEQLNNAAWSKVGTAPTITDNHATGPNGRPATRLQFTANGIGNRVQQVFAEAGGVRTISFLMKGEAGGESMQVGDGWTASSVITLTTSWQKVSLTLNASNPSTGVYLYAASGTPTVQVSEIQHEYGTVATTFEPKTNEGTRTETFRGNKADFPRLAGIVAEVANVTIYDLTEAGRPMWMRFNANTINSQIYGNVATLTAFNGLASVGTNGGISQLNFPKDDADLFRLVNQGLDYKYRRLALRNEATGAVLSNPNKTPSIGNNTVNAVAMTVLPDAPVDAVTGLQVPTIAVATAGGVSVIKHNGTVVNSSSTQFFTTITLDPDRLFGSLNSNSGLLYRTLIATKDLGGGFPLNNFSQTVAPDFSRNGASKNIAWGRRQLRRAHTNGMVSGMRHNESNEGASSTFAITNTFNTGHMLGDIRRAYLADVDVGSVSGTELVTNGTFDTSSDWSLVAGTAISGGTLNFSYAGSNMYWGVGQTLTTKTGAIYKVTYSITFSSSNKNVGLGWGAANNIHTATSNGTHTVYVTGTGSSVNFCFYAVDSVASVDNVSVREIVSDRSYKAARSDITGTLTKTQVAAASQLVAYSGFSAANYLREPYSADLDFGTGEWSASAWVNVPAVLSAVSALPLIGPELFSTAIVPTISLPAGSNGAYNTATGVFTSSANGSVAYGPYFNFECGLVTGQVYEVSGTISGANRLFSITLDGDGAAPGAANVGHITGLSNGAFTARLVAGKLPRLVVWTDGRTMWSDLQITNISIKRVSPFSIASRAHSSGASMSLGATGHYGFLTATAFDGTTTRTVTTTAAYNTGTMINPVVTYTTDGTLAIRVNGVEVAATRGTPLLTLNNSSAALTIGNSFAADAPFPGSISLLKLSATVPTTEQSQWMYEQEKQMFRDGAQVTLPDAGSIVDLAYDDATDKWLAVSATNESEWSGLVRTSVTASPAGSYSKISAASGIQLQARTTTNPGVDVTIPSYGLREELVNRSLAAARLARSLVPFDYIAGFTANTTSGSTAITSAAGITYPVSYVGARVSGAGIPADTFVAAVSATTIYLTKAATATATAVQISFNDFILPVGYEAKDVLLAGVSQREGATQAFTRLFDGFKETIRFTTAPSNTAFVQIQATRSIQ